VPTLVLHGARVRIRNVGQLVGAVVLGCGIDDTAGDTNLATRAQMVTEGWIPEGYGPVGVIMCAPQ
jgi:hypothetical protein